MDIGGLLILKKVNPWASLDLLVLLSGLTQDTCAVQVFCPLTRGMVYKNG
jgi:hypothetical protein